MSHACDADVAVVGGGLSGTLAAVVLARQGYRVVLIDRSQDYPPEFRVEKIAGEQVDTLRRLGVLDCVAAAATRFDEVINARNGRVIDKTRSPHYGIFYHNLVNVVRAELPKSVKFIVGQVVDVATGPQTQHIVLDDGSSLRVRLVVLATGMHDAIRRKLGIERKVTFEKHSISFGFNVAPDQVRSFDFPALTYYGEQIADRIDYINIFPIGDVMRANLFTFRDHRDEWIRTLRRQPEETLLKAMPGIRHFLGDFKIPDKVQNWVMDLYVVENYLQHGIVLIGDAFQTSCPAAGTGVGRLLTDVYQLCNVHVPQWLATPGMERQKIAQFYSDPAKRGSDNRASRLANYRRSLTIDGSWRWGVRRCEAHVRRRLVGWVRELRLARSSWQTNL
jgi:2-polyprenyl-6-methoxyphenol hydroxylase-like FAD-dependent oxidoreductase